MSLASTATPRAHSLLDRYGPQQKRGRKEAPKVQPIVIDDPYALEYPAMLRQPPEHTKKPNPNESEWQAPPKKPIEVLASRRDVLARMYACHQIDKAMFMAARDYQSIYEIAAANRVKTVDPSMPPIFGGHGVGAIDAVAAALHRLTRIENQLARQHGHLAVVFCREVLGQGLTIERAAARRGDGDREGVRWLGNLLRRCLRELAEISGFAVRGAYRNRAKEAARLERAHRREEKRRRAGEKPKRKKEGA